MDRRTPECKPLFDLDEVLSWQPGKDDLCVASVPRRPRKPVDEPRLLVCHDMKGGYLEDRLTDCIIKETSRIVKTKVAVEQGIYSTLYWCDFMFFVFADLFFLT